MKKCSIYIHIPFCVSKCSYCDFCSFVPQNEQIQDYINALFNEIDYYKNKYHDYSITSIYIGGGTPSVLPNGSINKILAKIKENFNVLSQIEITIEANPNSFTQGKAQEYIKAGCNRISFGLQTDKLQLLKILNRAHNFDQFKKAVELAYSIGITNINADIMFGIPTQTIKDVKNTLSKLIALPISHISAYSLICEPNTPLTKAIQQGALQIPTDDETVDMYDFAVKSLEDKGFYRYEISNFAKAGCESRHNLNYWERGEYLGLGLSACSFIEGAHWQNTSNLYKYLKFPTKVEDYEPETTETAKEEMIMLALRTIKGLDLIKYNKTFNADFLEDYKDVIDKLIKENLIEIANNHLVIKKIYISNSIIAEFFEV